MKKKIIIFAVLLLVISSLLLVACIPGNNSSNNGNGGNGGNTNNGNGGNGGSGVEEDPDKLDGWEERTVEQKTMYSDFLVAFTNVAYEASADKVSKNKQITGDIKLKFAINDNDFWLTLKAKYDETNPNAIRDKAIAVVELSSEEEVTDETRLLSVCLYKDELYVAIGKNKVKFSTENSNWTDYYPYKMKSVNSDSINYLTIGLNSIIRFKSEPKMKYRRNSSKEEYKYSLDIDVEETIKNLIINWKKYFKDSDIKISLETIKTFLSEVLNIDLNLSNILLTGKLPKLPETSLKLDFLISGKKISELKASFELDISEMDNYLIDADKLKIDLELDKVDITNDWANGVRIDFVNNQQERDSYKSYTEAIYAVSLPVDIYNSDKVLVADKYSLDITTRIFQEDQKSNFVFMEYKNSETKNVERALYVYNDKAYIYTIPEGETTSEFVCAFDINLSDVADRLMRNDLNGESELDIYSMIAYIIGNITLNKNEIKLAITPQFYNSVWFNFDDLVKYVDNEIGILANADVVEFINMIKNNEILLSLKFDDENMVSIIGENSKKITDVIKILNNVSEDIFIQIPEPDPNTEESDESGETNNEQITE